MKTEDAIREFRNRRRLALALKITSAAVSQWGENVPDLRAYQIRDILDARAQEKTSQSDQHEAAA